MEVPRQVSSRIILSAGFSKCHNWVVGKMRQNRGKRNSMYRNLAVRKPQTPWECLLSYHWQPRNGEKGLARSHMVPARGDSETHQTSPERKVSMVVHAQWNGETHRREGIIRMCPDPFKDVELLTQDSDMETGQ